MEFHEFLRVSWKAYSSNVFLQSWFEGIRYKVFPNLAQSVYNVYKTKILFIRYLRGRPLMIWGEGRRKLRKCPSPGKKNSKALLQRKKCLKRPSQGKKSFLPNTTTTEVTISSLYTLKFNCLKGCGKVKQ